MNRPKVSIVVAAYNVEKYINRCLESLAKQTLKEIEVLVINDGSKDRTESLSKIFEKSDQRFRVITQENGGLSEARNTGIKKAKAEFIAFLDGDDYAHPNMYEKLYERITQEKTDLVICGFSKIWEDEEFNVINQKDYKVNKKLLKGDIVKKFLTKHDEPFVVAWNKLYKLDIIKKYNINFENRAFFEDVGFIPRYLFYSNKVSIVNENLVYYIQRVGSITNNFNKIIYDSFENTIKLLEIFFKNTKHENYLDRLRTRIIIYIINKEIELESAEMDFLYSFKVRKGSISNLPYKHIIAAILLTISPTLYVKLLKQNMEKL
jgi:glycosyltransferase involved in cell wall biosynthesis